MYVQMYCMKGFGCILRLLRSLLELPAEKEEQRDFRMR